jgi:hypothetical protein
MNVGVMKIVFKMLFRNSNKIISSSCLAADGKIITPDMNVG